VSIEPGEVQKAEYEAGQIRKRLLQVIADQFGVPDGKIHNESHFMYDLGLDSLEIAQLQIAMEKEFKIEVSDTDMKDVTTVGGPLLFLKKVLDQK
jgi:acyl carrier protein